MRCVVTIIAVVLALAFLFVCVFAVVSIVRTFTLAADSRKDHVGIEFFEEKTYRNYMYGDAFDAMLVELDALDKGTAIDFYHTDNSWAAFTLLAGAPHIFALDIKIDQDKHSVDEILKDVDAGSQINDGDFTIYCFPRQEGAETDLKVIAVCEEKGIVRYIYVSKVTRLADYYSVLTRYAALDWGNQIVKIDRK